MMFCWHKWTPWRVRAEYEVTSAETGKVRGVALEQRRLCTKCNLTQLRFEKVVA